MATIINVLPRLPPHRPNAATKAAYQDKVPEIGRELCRQAIRKYVTASAPRRYRAKLAQPVRAELCRKLDRLLRSGVP
jgi:hypothetical protein